MLAKDLMTGPIIGCHVNDSLQLAASKMWEFDVGVLVALNDDGVVTGMLTDRDICMAAFTQGKTLDDMLVNSAMSRTVYAARPDTSIADVEELMAKHQVRRVPVLDADGHPLGLISMNDLAVESVQPDTKLGGAAKVTRTLAAICQPRKQGKAA